MVANSSLLMPRYCLSKNRQVGVWLQQYQTATCLHFSPLGGKRLAGSAPLQLQWFLGVNEKAEVPH